MNEYGFGISLVDIEAHVKKAEERKRKNSKKRQEGETFNSELMAGALSFDAKYGEEFYKKVVE